MSTGYPRLGNLKSPSLNLGLLASFSLLLRHPYREEFLSLGLRTGRGGFRLFDRLEAPSVFFFFVISFHGCGSWTEHFDLLTLLWLQICVLARNALYNYNRTGPSPR